MKREIKFRAWDKWNKKMVDVKEVEWREGVVRKVISVFDVEKKNYAVMAKDFELLQYTGLKDKKGKEIYEGDIVKWSPTREGGKVGQVIWNNLGLWHIKENYVDFPIGVYSNIEIIGNIYENPELLTTSAPASSDAAE